MRLTARRQLGLKYDDLMCARVDAILLTCAAKRRTTSCRRSLDAYRDARSRAQALLRLTPRQQYDRAYRIKVAHQCSLLHRDLPKEQWTTSETVRRVGASDADSAGRALPDADHRGDRARAGGAVRAVLSSQLFAQPTGSCDSRVGEQTADVLRRKLFDVRLVAAARSLTHADRDDQEGGALSCTCRVHSLLASNGDAAGAT